MAVKYLGFYATATVKAMTPYGGVYAVVATGGSNNGAAVYHYMRLMGTYG